MTHSNLTPAAVLDSNGRVMADAKLPADARIIEIAGARTADGAPVNRKSFKVSRSRRNLEKAKREQIGIAAFEHGGDTFYMLVD